MERRSFRIDLLSTLLLGAGAVATSWSSYQATRWSGVQADQYSRANTIRIQASEHLTTAGQLRGVDIAAFGAWLRAYAEHRATEAEFYERRFRREFVPAFDAWVASKPKENPAAAATPFELTEYRLHDLEQATQLDRAADAATEVARTANQQSDDYVLVTVLFAIVLFFAGLAPQVKWGHGQVAMLVIASLVCLGGLSLILRFPVE